ncbi:DUF3566 domain-containing protein [Cellulomonas fimi]|uniref:DUF3566 domain-containing protein n=1 Tax=Cellulomonas fimi (strain ATCC 484 / DSM 20113 / JCM 1341 / CCUG 24087 / LMG 16345 / NBRC 15513 / NCIMB 8980 / NCTC 7547 / NRS-133) TaxID=590998 RepID=F4H3T6_CELFA|nr:DUF3566 domain-containing protein [Cellulomonas fimi]AEE44160.1 hypothetical protein Celf_0008 [Cellulomonas fimi ATCC 484]NNH07574.1 hypothetical protein [Cellulomonas fimi]VEH25787.1 Transmembrane domain of uncharacterised function (DUF3566) [Cellulomonas fimi]
MTDPTPPTIPPRLKPTTPTTARPSASGNGSSGARNGSGRTETAPPRGPAPTASEPRRDATDRPEAPVRVSTGVPRSTDEQEPPSPLMVAVDTATVWFKKAAGATSSALASVTRPRTEDPTMTSPASAPAATATRPPSRPATGATPLARPATGRIPTVGGPRRVRLAISRVDPWSVMKLSFLLSVAIGIMIVVAAAVIWLTLDGLHVFAKIDDLVTQITGSEGNVNILEFVEFRRVVSGATLIAVVDVFLMTALATIGAFLYNIVAALVGGVHVTMTDE